MTDPTSFAPSYLKVLNMAAVSLYAMNKMLYNFLANFIAENCIIAENGTHSLGVFNAGV